MVNHPLALIPVILLFNRVLVSIVCSLEGIDSEPFSKKLLGDI